MGRVIFSFTVAGIPKPKGSKRAFVVQPKGGNPRAVLVESAGDALSEWMDRIRSAARLVAPEALLECPVQVSISFRMVRPKCDMKRGGDLKDDAPRAHTKAPDIDKLARAALDALQGVMFRDDSQVCALSLVKRYEAAGTPPGAHFRVETDAG